jgi:hypothetical protein
LRHRALSGLQLQHSAPPVMSANATLAEMAFYRSERPVLIAQGIVDYDQQCALLKRR